MAVKKYRAGDKEEKHFHKIAAEITVITEGEAVMNNEKLKAGDIVILEPCEASDFTAVTDVTTTVVKIPSVKNDKYDGEPDA